MNRNTIIAPCSVKKRLYFSAVTTLLAEQRCCGFSSARRTSSAKMPPIRNATSTATRYMTPMRLWSTVDIQLQMPVVRVEIILFGPGPVADPRPS